MYTLKKSLGQHFLHEESVIQRIIDAWKESPCDQWLEVGPGGGALTRYLSKEPGIVLKAVELDAEKADYLLKEGILQADQLIRRSFLDMPVPFEGTFCVIGNFPYNISTQILFQVLDWKNQVPVVIGMFQKEVAQRVAAAPGSKVYGVISVLIQAFYRVEYLFDVKPGSFQPPPKVMSGVIRLNRRTDVPLMHSESFFKTLVKQAFSQRRKTLRNAVKSLFNADELADPLFDRRAETLSVDEWAALTFRMRGSGQNT